MERKISASDEGNLIESIILGGQDGLVNVLGIILGVATATNDQRIVIIAGLAATFAESISMAAVAFTSKKAAKQFYESEKKRLEKLVEENRSENKKLIEEVYSKKGFAGNDLQRAVEIITSNKKVFVDTILSESLNLSSYSGVSPSKNAVIVGLSAFVGSLVPLVPFFFVDVKIAFILSLVFSVVILFIVGALKAKWTIGGWKKNGFEMVAIGMVAALSGYIIGILLS